LALAPSASNKTSIGNQSTEYAHVLTFDQCDHHYRQLGLDHQHDLREQLCQRDLRAELRRATEHPEIREQVHHHFRRQSSSVANAFNSSSGGSAHEYAASGGGGTPNELNFFFTVQINVTTSKGSGSTLLNIGQGHYGTTNNWWLGGAGLTSSKPSLTIPVANGAYNLTLPISGTHDSYTFSAGTIADAYPITNVFVLMLENHSAAPRPACRLTPATSSPTWWSNSVARA